LTQAIFAVLGNKLAGKIMRCYGVLLFTVRLGSKAIGECWLVYILSDG